MDPGPARGARLIRMARIDRYGQVPAAPRWVAR